MAFLTKADLTPPLYPEIIDEITRGDDSIVDKAITLAIGEMKSYLNRYDLVAMFGSSPVITGVVSMDGGEVDSNPTFYDEFLNSLAKDIIAWHLIKLSNPNINLTLFRTAYEDAIKFLDKVMRGERDPVWPLLPIDPLNPLDESGFVGSSSNPRRRQFY